MRFIEFMPLDADRHWTRDLVVPAAEVHQRINACWPLQQIPHERSETARKYRFADGAPGEIGLIAPVTQPFCGHCSRIDRKSTRLNSSHRCISYAVFCLKKKKI